MAKKIMAALMIVVMICVMIVPAHAAAVVFDTKVWYLAWTSSTTNYTKNWQSFTAPSTINTSSTSSNNLCFAFKTNMIIPDDAIIVIVMNMQNYNLSSLTFRGVGQATSGTLPTAQTTTNELEKIQYTQEIIANTQIPIDNGTQFTITVKAKGFTNLYPIIGFKDLRQQTSNTSISIKSIDLYQSVQEAASSGTTPEEMRDVLSSWSEEELIPGIGQAVGDKIEEVVPDAILDGMDEHDNQLKTEGGSVIENIKDQIGETITPYFENTDQIRDAIHGGASGIFGYTGTDAVITLPAARNPLTGNSLMWNEYQIDLGMYYNRLPAVLRQLISALLTMLVSIGVIREILDTVNTILIHREILGMPDDYLKSWTRKDDF